MKSNYFKVFLESRRKMYKEYDSMYCSCLKEDVVFNISGFNHLRFKIDNTPRNPKEAMYKLGLLPLVRPVIYKAKNIDSYEIRMSPIGGSRKKVIRKVEYWSLISKVGKKDIKTRVILRRIEKGKMHFWSVMKLVK